MLAGGWPAHANLPAPAPEGMVKGVKPVGMMCAEEAPVVAAVSILAGSCVFDTHKVA